MRKFYSDASQLAIETEVIAVLTKLADIEIRHKQKLFDLFKRLDSEDTPIESFEKRVSTELMEGGFDSGALLEEPGSNFNSAAEVLNFAMMLEAQGMDLYMRYAEKSENAEVREILFDMAEDEKAHLKSLGNLMKKV